ncbi:uncharacterized protein LOC141915538 isoform X2 [Tubulanus polymorphus]|uniref:uncharacterized protein LOC141915538 isoform X2 n=1 Tax=Tubulanus polymorphus TaxID=672921 RepID=UPI003DA5FFF9
MLKYTVQYKRALAKESLSPEIEHSVVNARASVMLYDDPNKRWVASGQSQGLSKVHIYHHSVNNTFRVVGRKLQDHEVVINCAILRGLKYNEATPTFHQWRDNRQVYGLNFTSKEDADSFACAMHNALDRLNKIHRNQQQNQQPQQQQNQQQQQQQQQQSIYHTPHVQPQNQNTNQSNYSPNFQNGPQGEPEDDRRTPNQHQREDYQTHQRKISQGSSGSGGYRDPQQLGPTGDLQPATTPTIPAAPPECAPVATPAPAIPQAPPAPPPPPVAMKVPAATPAPQPAAPPPPPAPPAPPAPPLPNQRPPPQQDNNDDEDNQQDNPFAQALRAQKLRKCSVPSDRDSGIGKVVDGGTMDRGSRMGGGLPTAGDMMSEMAARLAARRKKAEGQDSDTVQGAQSSSVATVNSSTTPNSAEKKPWERNGNGSANRPNGSESPKVTRSRRNMSLTGQETLFNGSLNNQELEMLKQEILAEMRKELQKTKQEIIEAIVSKLK